MPYIPLQESQTRFIPFSGEVGGGYIPLPELPTVLSKPKSEKPVSPYERPKLPEEKIRSATAFLQSEEDDPTALKALKWLGRMVIEPFTPYIQDVMEVHALNEISRGVAEGKYDPRIFDEIEVLKKTSLQVAADAAKVAISVSPLRAFQTVRGLPILSAQALKILAITGAEVGGAYGVAEAVSARPKPLPTEILEEGITGAVGGAIGFPVLGTAGRALGKVVTAPFRALTGKAAEKIEPTLIERILPERYMKRVAEVEGIPEEAIRNPPHLNAVEEVIEPLSPVRQMLQKDKTASYIGLQTRNAVRTQQDAYQNLFDENWARMKNAQSKDPEGFSRIVELQERGVAIDNAPQETKSVLASIRANETKTYELAKKLGVDVSGWRFTPENHFSHVWTGSQTIIDTTSNKILAFADNRTRGIAELLRLHAEKPQAELVMRPRIQLYRGSYPVALSQKQFFRFLSQVADVMQSDVNDVMSEVSLQGIARIKPKKTKIPQFEFRKGELGDYTTDPTKIYPSLWYKLTKRLYIDPKMRSLALRLGNIEDPSIRDVASKLIDAVSGEYQKQIIPYKLTSLITSAQAQLKLGGRLSPPLVNMLQRFFSIGIVGEKNFIRAQADIVTAEGQRILKQVGVSAEVPIYEGMGRTRVRRWFNPLYIFGKTEGGKYVGNRNAVALSAYYKGEELPLEVINGAMEKSGLPVWKSQDALATDFSRAVVDGTQYRYDISDFPPVMRNNLGKTLFQFKTFAANAMLNSWNVVQGKPLAGLELFYPQGLSKTQAVHQAVIHFGMMFTQGGIRALSFGIERVVPAATLTWLALKAPALLYGISAFLGFDVSRSATVEMSNLTSLLPIADGEKVWKAIQEKNPKLLLQISPAAYRIYQTLDAMEHGNYLRDIETGKNVLQLKPIELAEYGFGINPLRVTQEQQVHSFKVKHEKELNQKVATAKRNMWDAMQKGDFDLAKNIYANLKREGVEIRPQDFKEFIVESELPRILRDYKNFRKSERPKLKEPILEFFRQEK